MVDISKDLRNFARLSGLEAPVHLDIPPNILPELSKIEAARRAVYELNVYCEQHSLSDLSFIVQHCSKAIEDFYEGVMSFDRLERNKIFNGSRFLGDISSDWIESETIEQLSVDSEIIISKEMLDSLIKSSESIRSASTKALFEDGPQCMQLFSESLQYIIEANYLKAD